MILILTQCFPPVIGGVENLIGNMATAMAEKEKTVWVYADSSLATMEYDKQQPFKIRRFGGIKFLRRRYKAFVANKHLREGKFSHVFCDSWKSLEFLNQTPKNPITVLAHGTEYPLSPSAEKKRRIENTLKKANNILAVSEATRKRVCAYSAGIQQMRVWHPPITPAAKANDEDKKRANNYWGSASPRLLSVARLEKRKGIDTAISAFARLAADYPQAVYIVAGDGDQATELRTLTKRLGLNVYFTGVVSEGLKSALYENADVFILPVRPAGDDMEGFGLVFLEAGYHGTPSITGNSGGAAEAVEDEKTGLHCEGTDIESVAGALKRILDDDDLRRRLSEAAQQKAINSAWPTRIEELLR